MKRLIIKSSLIILLPILLVTVAILLLRDDYSLHSNEINASLAYDRLSLLRNDAKIVIIAGSNGSWSINSEMLHDEFGLPVVNTATHAGMGVRMQFEIYKRFLCKGDILVFCPEYYDGISRLYGGSTLIRIVSTHFPQEYFRFSIGQWRYIYKYIGIHISECWQHIGKSAKDGPYSAKAVNQYGDIDCVRPHENFDESYTFKGKLDNEALEYYKYVFEYAKEKGVIVAYLPPTLMKRNYLDQQPQIDSLAHYMEQHGIPYQSPTIRYMFPDTLYCNTPYHMTSEGARQRTVKLIEDLKNIISKHQNEFKRHNKP